MRIPCPYCGSRDSREFVYYGDATVTRPDPENSTPEDWCQYVLERRNPLGDHVEYWLHAQGCRQVLRVERNTQTHKVGGAQIVGPWAQSAKREAAE